MPADQPSSLPAQSSPLSGTFVRVKGDPGDWPGMLLRLYLRWAERMGLKGSWVDGQPDLHPAGNASGILCIEGPNAFHLLRGETGLHRLVHAAVGRQALAAVDVLPDLAEPAIPAGELLLEHIRPAELRTLG
jgi:protein subunit release factor B